MPENDFLTCIYCEGKLPYNGTNIGIHRCENAQKTLDFPYAVPRTQFRVFHEFNLRILYGERYFFAVVVTPTYSLARPNVDVLHCA